MNVLRPQRLAPCEIKWSARARVIGCDHVHPTWLLIYDIGANMPHTPRWSTNHSVCDSLGKPDTIPTPEETSIQLPCRPRSPLRLCSSLVTRFAAVVLSMCMAWTLLNAPVLAANACSTPAQDESLIDHGVDWMADVCATWVLEPADRFVDKLKDLNPFGDDSLNDDQIELEVVDVSEWEFLDDTTRQRFFDVGLAPNVPRRTEEEAETLYEAIPGTTRALGEARLLEFLDNHTLTYLTPVPDILREVDAPDNLIWELRTIHEARGERSMTAAEFAAATIALRRTGQEAASTSSQTWYILNSDPEFIESFKYLGLANGTRTQAQAFELYNTIPAAFRNEGFWVVLYFFAVHDLSFRLPVADDPQLASTLGNVVWEDRLLKAGRQGAPLTDTDLAAAEHALWVRSLTAGTPSSRTWYKLIQDREASTWLHSAGEQALPDFNGSLAELRLVYDSLPEWVRVAGPDAARTFLASNNPVPAPGTVVQVSPTWLLSRATSQDNLVWEARELAESRGPRAMTQAELATAEEALRARFEAAKSVIELGYVPEIAIPQPMLDDIPITIRRRLARLGLTAAQPDRMPAEILALYRSIPSPIRAQGRVPVEDFLDRFTISHPVPAAFEPGHQVPPESYLWEKHATVRARGGTPVAAEEFMAAKFQMLRVAQDAMPMATWVVLKDDPEFRLRFDQLARELSAPMAINIPDLYQSIPQAVLLLGPDAVLDFLSEFGLSLKRPLSEFLAMANTPTNLAWELSPIGTVVAPGEGTSPGLATDSEHATATGGSPARNPALAVHGDSWHTLDPSLQQHLAFVGLAPNTWFRTLDETVALYMSIPEGVRAQGNVAVRDFLDTHTVSRKVSLTDVLSVATSVRNSIWESSESALTRGFAPLTAADIVAAREALVETYIKDLEVLKEDPVLAGLVAGLYVGGRQVLPRLQTPPPPIRPGGTWDTLSPLLRQRFFGRGIPVGLPRRTALEAQALYLTVPPSIRIQGDAAVRDFLDTFQLSYRQPVTTFPALARVPGNAVWEPLETAVDRVGPMTSDEVRRARGALRQAAKFAVTRSGMTWYALMDEPGFLNNLKQRGLRNAYRTQSEVKALYKTIPRGVRIQGPDAVKTFLDEVHLSHIVPVSERLDLQKRLDNVVWEDPELNLERGPRRMTDDEVRAARRELKRIGRQAGSRSNRTWHAIAQNQDRLGKFLDLDSPKGVPHSRYRAKSLYEQIPREIRDLGWEQVDEFVAKFDLTNTSGHKVTAANADLTWEKRSHKVKRGDNPWSPKDTERAQKAVDGTLKDMADKGKALRATARTAALKTATRNALVGGLAGVVLELPVSGGITFMEWHHGRISAEMAIRQVALDAAIASGVSVALVGGGTLLTTLAPGVATVGAVAAPVVIPVILVASAAGGVAFLAAQVHQFCVSAQPEPTAP